MSLLPDDPKSRFPLPDDPDLSHRSGDARRLALRDIQNDLSSFHIAKYAPRVDGFLVTAKNSGTHWLRFMLSAAIAHHTGLPAPEHSSGPNSDTFIGHPKHAPKHPTAPRIGSSHNIPSRAIAPQVAAGVLSLPPLVVLVRDPREALASYFVKWREAYDLGSLPEFLRRPAPGKRKIDDVWWFIRFFNRWGEVAQVLPERVMIVRHEDVAADPGAAVRRIWAHWGVELTDADVAAAVAISDRKSLARKLDPSYGEAIVPDRARREAATLSPVDEAYLAELFRRHLKHSFGYDLTAGLNGPDVHHAARQA
jgi:hypothetical protein